MEKTVNFRTFRESDVNFIYKVKNDEKLNLMTVGQFHKFTNKEAENWVKGCMTDDSQFKFWAITPIDNDNAIGYCSLVAINQTNKSAETGAIVIGDPDYNDGIAWIETVMFLFEYAFERLNLNRVYGKSLLGHKISNQVEDLMFMQREGVLRQAVFKNGRFYDISYAAILKNDYYAHKTAGDFEIMSVIRRLRKLRKEKK